MARSRWLVKALPWLALTVCCYAAARRPSAVHMKCPAWREGEPMAEVMGWAGKMGVGMQAAG